MPVNQSLVMLKKTDQAVSHDARDESVKGNQQQEFITDKRVGQYTNNQKRPETSRSGIYQVEAEVRG